MPFTFSSSHQPRTIESRRAFISLHLPPSPSISFNSTPQALLTDQLDVFTSRDTFPPSRSFPRHQIRMDFGPFVNAVWAGLPKPFLFARQIVFGRNKFQAQKKKASLATATACDDARVSPFSTQNSGTSYMHIPRASVNAESRATRCKASLWGSVWVMLLFSIIPVVVVTLSGLFIPSAKLSGASVDFDFFQASRPQDARQCLQVYPPFMCAAWTSARPTPPFVFPIPVGNDPQLPTECGPTLTGVCW